MCIFQTFHVTWRSWSSSAVAQFLKNACRNAISEQCKIKPPGISLTFRICVRWRFQQQCRRCLARRHTRRRRARRDGDWPDAVLDADGLDADLLDAVLDGDCAYDAVLDADGLWLPADCGSTSCRVSSVLSAASGAAALISPAAALPSPISPSNLATSMA